MFLSVNCSGGLLVVFSLFFFFFNILNIESSWKHCRLQRVCLRSRPCLYIRLSAAAEHWDRCVHSICMRGVEVCACAPACVCVSVREGARETRKKTENGGESCICMCSRRALPERVGGGPGAGTCSRPWAGNARIPGLCPCSLLTS